MKKFEIHCGEHNGIIEAETIGEAWRKLTADKTEGFARLANYRPISEYGLGKNRYITPEGLDRLP